MTYSQSFPALRRPRKYATPRNAKPMARPEQKLTGSMETSVYRESGK